MELYHFSPGNTPLLISSPHAGNHVPEEISARLVKRAHRLPDTDWHVDRLYEFAKAMGANMLSATHSRYVVDLNRAPDNHSLYPGQFTTGLCPTQMFNGEPLYRDGKEPSEEEITRRITHYWQPYHDKLQGVLSELRTKFPRVVLIDAHSICSIMPLLFEGTLPDINLGTDGGKSADMQLIDAILPALSECSYSHVLNGRFKGGYITRHYGQPDNGIHSLQIELSQKNYMDEAAPYTYNEETAQKLQKVLKNIISATQKWIST